MIFYSSDTGSVEAWGPTASVDVKVDALRGVVNNSWLLVNLSVGAREIVDVRQCFNDVSVIYALGNDQGRCVLTLTFAIFIGRKNCKKDADNTTAIDKGLSAYASNRISKRTTKSAITIGQFSREGWLTGVDIGQVDASKGICYGTVHFIMELK